MKTDLRGIVEGIVVLQAITYSYKIYRYYSGFKPLSKRLIAEGMLTQKEAEDSLRSIRVLLSLPSPLDAIGYMIKTSARKPAQNH